MAWVNDVTAADASLGVTGKWIPYALWKPEVLWGPCFSPAAGRMSPRSPSPHLAGSSSSAMLPATPHNSLAGGDGHAKICRPPSDRAVLSRTHLVEKNTFIEMERPLGQTVEGFMRERETISDPTSSRASSRTSSCSSGSSSSSRGGEHGTDHDLKGKQIQVLDSLYFDGQPLPAYSVPKPAGLTKHDQGTCTPCPFLLSPDGCLNGAECCLCHLSHNLGRDRQKPCKWKRQKFKDILDEQKGLIVVNPLAFEITNMDLPSFILEDDRVYAKLVGELCRLWADTRSLKAGSDPKTEQAIVASRLVLLPRPRRVIKVAL